MATPIITPVPLLLGSQKIGEVTTGTFDINANISQQICDAGVVNQVGRSTCTLNFSVLIPKGGLKQNLFAKLLGKADITAILRLNGQMHKTVGKLTTGKASWNWADGSCSGEFTLVGDEPQLIG